MGRADLGFGFFLILLLLAPGIPVPGFAAGSSVSPAAVGLVVWFMLAPRLPVRAVLTMPTVLALMGFAIYALLVSLASGQLVSIVYALQYACYAVLGGFLIPAYLAQKLRQGRELEAWRILAWIGVIYVAGIIVSYWAGPIWSFQGPGGKQYGDLVITRGRGFSDAVNAAAGIAALFSVFYLSVYPLSRLRSAGLAAFGFTGLVLTLSRSAIVSSLLALFVLAGVLVFRALCLRGKVSLRLRLVPVALAVAVVAAGLVSYQLPMVAAAWERLALDQDYLSHDVDLRLYHWSSGIEQWTDLSPIQWLIGAGFRSGGLWLSTGAFATSHNAYIEMFRDFGIVGLIMFLAILAASAMRATRLLLSYPDNALARFCLCGLTILVVHNLTQVFFYDIATLMWLVLLLACNELAGRRMAAVSGGALRFGAAHDSRP